MTAFSPPRMGRGRGQILHRFRPGQTFDHQGGFVARVVTVGNDDAYAGPDVDRDHVISQAMAFVQLWRNRGNGASGSRASSDRAPGFPEFTPLAAGEYDVVIPGRVLSRVWPLVLRCNECGIIYEAEEPQHGTQWPARCPNNHAGGVQLQYVFVHECGELRQMSPPNRCARCAGNQFRLGTDVSRFMDFRWRCVRCSNVLNVMATCSNPQCSWSSRLMKPQIHTASGAYAPQGFTLVNVPRRGDVERRRSPHYTTAVLGLVVGAINQDQFERLVSGTEMPEVMRVSLKVLEENGLEEQAAALRRRFGSPEAEEVRRAVVQRLGVDPQNSSDGLMLQLAEQLDLYQRVVSQDRLSLHDLRGLAVNAERRDLYQSYERPLQRAGFDLEGVFLSTRFPVARIGVGYSRGGFEPNEADLVPYRGRPNRGSGERTLLFAHPTETEALVFTLEQEYVTTWLADNELIDREHIAHVGGLRNWLARELHMVDAQTPEIDGDAQRAQTAIYTLLHTTAHQLLRAVAVDSGFGEAALSEYLFPYNFAFAIYPNSSSEFTIGGLRTVVEQVLGEVVSRAFDNDSCLYDPNCYTANEGADHGCLFLPETSCTGWNRNLSRWVLFGGGPYQRGYWQSRIGAN